MTFNYLIQQHFFLQMFLVFHLLDYLNKWKILIPPDGRHMGQQQSQNYQINTTDLCAT